MNRTTTAEATWRPPASALRAAAQSSSGRIAAAALTISLLLAGCTARQDAATPRPLATDRSATEETATVPAAPAPGSAIPVRPATPLSPTPKNPAPRFLTVDGTAINMSIVEVGVSPDGAMEIPESFNEAGWYRFGPAPGAAAGAAVVAAHVDTTSDSAPFSQLKSLEPGTFVTVRREGAAPLTFRVTGVELMAKDAFDGASIFRRDGPHQLKLVTCGGRWLDEQQDYGDNVIVTAVPA
ncbi:class F sortase [Arthrobacter sp. SO3]|uniref:class F sortase n=1 Tax=Arthrobacter sp. SO3 TaxID=1897057 RepID=UPI001CFFED39|nr:class F sortase [Arthrobacter sp. SO3]MCB5291629.1 hypothetical protein [Arthrobacter sp. SO3]